MKATETIEKAIEVTEQRRRAAPSFPIFESVETQLVYLRRVLAGEERDRSRLREIILGVYAVKEFEESDPELAALLKEAQLIAANMAKGLKV